MSKNAAEKTVPRTVIKDKFWTPRREINRKHSLFYQWEQYEKVGTINNFRIAAGLAEGKRQGFFYTDSDFHKWADGACRVLAVEKDPKLAALVKEYVALVTGAADEDGYLYTFNQVNFPGTRWVNLQIEHELYCMGHFIEAAIEHSRATKGDSLLETGERCAGLICRDFADRGAEGTPGHQEIEVALMRLYQHTGKNIYRYGAEHFLNMRGRKRLFGFMLFREFMNHGSRMKATAEAAGEKNAEGFDYTEVAGRDMPPLMGLRLNAAFLSGRYHQQHKPIIHQKKPAGHAVRWAYMQMARTMAAETSGDNEDLGRQEKLWQELLNGYTYVTGGIGSLPMMEGFGRRYELNNRYAYCETCAAIGSIFWNHELFQATGSSRYADFLEWQLYNAFLVGASASGDAWFYRNPLDSSGDIERRPWFDTACCPSNVSRLLASLDRYITLWHEDTVRICQYISCREKKNDRGHSLTMESSLPFGRQVTITVTAGEKHDCTVQLRIPSWCSGAVLAINGLEMRYLGGKSKTLFGSELFSSSRFESVTVPKGKKYLLNLEFNMPVRLLTAHPKVRGAKRRFTVTRGPLVYCLEEWRNSHVAHDGALLLPSKIKYRDDSEETGLIVGRDRTGPDLFFTPFFNWGNNGKGWMQVWIKRG